MIEITNLTKTYAGHIHALDDVSLTIGSGMFGLLGANGAGKTTLMRIMAGLVKPSGGRIVVLGHDMASYAGQQATKALLGYLPQELGFYPNLSAREFLDYLAILKGVADPKIRRTQIDTLIEMVRLTDAADRRLKTYSGGMKRRFGIASALLGSPQLLIVDEPTVGLDPEERIRLRNLLADLARRCTVILSTHIIEDIGASCTQLAVMAKGRVTYQGTPAEMIAQARGHVWTVTTAGEAPLDSGSGDVGSIVSMRQMSDGVQYRMVGEHLPNATAQAVEPSLEDGYMWLTRGTEKVSSG